MAGMIAEAAAIRRALAEGAAVGLHVVLGSRNSAWDLDELVEPITSANRHEEIEWGEPEGRETW